MKMILAPSTWLLFIALGWVPHRSVASDGQDRKLPAAVERVVRWLPEDTETLIVAQAASLSEFNEKDIHTFRDLGINLATGELDSLSNGKYSKPLHGRKIECIVNGARNFEGVSKSGSLRSESCAILVFSDDLGDAATEWVGVLRKDAEEVRTLAGREVFVFPSATVMERVKRTKWQGTYFVLLNPNTLLCASSDRYLESVLRRVDNPSTVRALPDDLPEWERVELDAPVWILRHVPKAQERIRVVGATAALRADGFHVMYIPRQTKEINIEAIEAEWLPELLFGTKLLREQLKISRHPDGTIALSSGGKIEEDNIWFFFQIGRLSAFELFQFDK